MLRASSGDGLLDFGPLSEEVSERLGLDGRPTSKFDGVSAELNGPLDDVAVGLLVAENVPQRELSDHGDLVTVKITLKLERRNQDCI